MRPEPHPDPASPSHAESAFAFLLALGFQLHERFVTGGTSSRDGWRLQYAGSRVHVTVQYFDAQFEVHFERAGIRTDYLFVDRERFGRRSGMYGNMFPPQKLAPAVDSIARDIRDHYGALLAGDDTEWSRIKRLASAPTTKSRLP